ERDNEVIAGKNGYYASATIDKKTKELVVKVSNYAAEAREIDLNISGVKKLERRGKNVYMTSGMEEVNSIENPLNVSPKEKEVRISGNKVKVKLEHYSFNVFKFKVVL